MDMTLIKEVRDLAKNPLGIIALFIALIYGFATLLLGVSAEKLSPDERYPIILFVVLFPILVLAVFYRLVTSHHGKLYAPADYKNDESFLRTLTEKQREDKLEEEIRSAEFVALEEPNISEYSTKFSRSSTSNDSQKHSVGSSLKSQYMEAEKLAITKIEIDRGLLFRKQVAFDGKRMAAFDGVAMQDDAITVLEVKLLRKSLVPPSFIRETLYRAVIASNLIRDKFDSAVFKLIIALVVEDQSRPIEEVQKIASRIVEDAPFSVEILVFNLKDLKADLGSPDYEDNSAKPKS